MRAATLSLIGLLLCGCQLAAYAIPEYTMTHSLAYYDVPQFDTVDDANTWVFSVMKYIPHAANEWQTPERTLALRSGDCEDFAITLMYILKAEGGKTPTFVIVHLPYDPPTIYHAIVGYEGFYLDPTSGAVIRDLDAVGYRYVHTLSYSDAMAEDVTMHGVYW